MARMSDEAKRRWYRLTPGHFLAVLLAAEGLLFLSERYHWFAFSQHKGWPVLIAVAGVGVFFVLMLLWFAAALLFRWRFQFSLLSLLVLMLAVALPFGWLETEMKAAQKQRATIKTIEKLGGETYDDSSEEDLIRAVIEPPSLPWLHALLGDDFFMNVTWVDLHGPQLDDAMLEHLKELPQLREVWLFDASVTDAAIDRLKGVAQFQRLLLSGDNVKHVNLERIRGLTQLRSLSLHQTEVTHARMKYFEGMPQLSHVALCSAPLDGPLTSSTMKMSWSRPPAPPRAHEATALPAQTTK
jgi:hypothetical protein